MTVRVEPAGVDRVDELADRWVDLAAGQRAHGARLRAEPNRTAVRESLARHAVSGGLLVAVDDADGDPEKADGRTVGFVSFHPERDDYERDARRGVVENLYVVPDRRGEGIGSRLLAAAEDALRAADCEVVALEAMADNERARRFYRRRGYTPHRVELERPLGTDTDTRDDA